MEPLYQCIHQGNPYCGIFCISVLYCVSGYVLVRFSAVFIAAGDFCLTEFRGRRLRTDKRKLKMIDAFTRVSYRGPESFIRNLRIPNGSCDMTEHVISKKLQIGWDRFSNWNSSWRTRQPTSSNCKQQRNKQLLELSKVMWQSRDHVQLSNSSRGHVTKILVKQRFDFLRIWPQD